jgi:hypothetical protein
LKPLFDVENNANVVQLGADVYKGLFIVAKKSQVAQILCNYKSMIDQMSIFFNK